jgi:hypothetical protein
MRLAICDSDIKYLENIQAYLIKLNPMDFEILAFNSLFNAIEQSRKRSFEIFLIGESIYEEAVSEVNAGKILILKEDGFLKAETYDWVVKYQSVNRLIGQVLEKYASDETCTSQIKCGKNDTSLITFYSPEHHGAQSLSALTAAQLLSEMGHNVLYMNLHSFSGFEELMNTTHSSDITDFMYFVLKRSDKLLYKLEGMKRNIRGVDYLPPATDYQALANIKPDEWRQAFDLVMYSCEYTHIVVDISENCQGFYEILDRSQKAYILYNNNSKYGQASFNHFTQILTAKEWGRILERITTFSLPYEIVSRNLELDNLVNSDIGIYMKGVIA